MAYSTWRTPTQTGDPACEAVGEAAAVVSRGDGHWAAGASSANVTLPARSMPAPARTRAPRPRVNARRPAGLARDLARESNTVLSMGELLFIAGHPVAESGGLAQARPGSCDLDSAAVSAMGAVCACYPGMPSGRWPI